MLKRRIVFSIILIVSILFQGIGVNLLIIHQASAQWTPLDPVTASMNISSSISTEDNKSSDLEVLRSDENGLLLEVRVPTYQVSESVLGGLSYQRLEVAGMSLTSDPGQPQLPVLGALIGVPADCQIRVEMLEDTAVPLVGRYDLPPAPSPEPLNDDLAAGGWSYQKNMTVYTSEDLYPQKVVRVANEAWIRDQRVVRIEFFPLQYLPAQNQVIWHQRLLVRVDFVGSQKNEQNQPAVQESKQLDNLYESVLQASLLNYSIARTWRQMPKDIGGVETSVEGPRYKIAVNQDGLYRLTYDDLQAAGMDVEHVDPRTFSLTSQGEDVAIYVAGEGDGHFDPMDYVLFYGEKFRGDHMADWYADENTNWLTYTQSLTDGTNVPWHPQFNAFMLEKYTDDNVYWLQVGIIDNPLRMSEVDGTPGIAPIPSAYTATVHAEKALRHWEYHFTSEDTWFWDVVLDYGDHTYTSTLTAEVPGTMATVRGDMVAYSYNDYASGDHHTRVWMNSNTTDKDDATWEARSRYRFNFQVPSSSLLEGENKLHFQIVTGSTASPQIFFDWYEVEYQRYFKAESNSIQFTGEENGDWRYQITSFKDPAIQVFEITDPLNPVRVLNPSIAPVGSDYTATFEVANQAGDQYIMVAEPAVRKPKSLTFYDPPDLRSSQNGADYIIIAHQDFVAAAQALANYRSEQGLRTLVVSLKDVVNEFNEGIYHPIAIKNFLKYTFAYWKPPAPSYVVLIGDGTWNFKGANPAYYGTAPLFMPPNMSWVDPWQAEVDSSNLLATIIGTDPIPDYMIGRIPINTVDELNTVINKIISYEQSPVADWQRNNVFVADNTPDSAGDFVAMSESVIEDVMEPGFTPLRIYENDYIGSGNCGTRPYPGGPSCPNVNQAITGAMNNTGALFINYVGHAAPHNWAAEQILLYHPDDPANPNDEYYSDFDAMNNATQLPVVLSMTCLDGYWIDPRSAWQPSLAELFLRAGGSGAVATFSPTGLGIASGHDILQRGFYYDVYQNGDWILGPATVNARLYLYGTGSHFDLVNTFTVFGDPALRMLSPYSLEYSPEKASQSGLTGTTVTYTIQLTNTSPITDIYDITLTGNSWVTSLPYATTTLLASEATIFTVTVQIPEDVPGGAMDLAVVKMSSQGDSDLFGEVHLETIANVYGIDLEPSFDTRTSTPGSRVTYALQVMNTSNADDTFDLTLGLHTWATTPSELTIGPLGSGEEAAFSVDVDIPVSASDYETDTVVISLTSQADPQRIATSTLQTTARTYGVLVNPAFQYGEGRADELVEYQLRVENTGGYPDVFNVSLVSDRGWAVNSDPSVVGPLEPEQEAVFTVTEQIPSDVLGGTVDTTQVTVSSQNDPNIASVASLYTTANVYGLELTSVEDSQIVLPGTTVTYTLSITNLANVNDIFDVSVGDHSWNTEVSPLTFQLLSGEQMKVVVCVYVPDEAAPGEVDSITIMVTSRSDPSKSKALTLSTSTQPPPQSDYTRYLPMAYK